MTSGSRVAQTVTMSYKVDDAGNGRHHAEVALSITGALEVAEQHFDCVGLLDTKQARLLAVYARWALARQMLWSIERDPSEITAVGDLGSWSTRVIWNGNIGCPTLAVTVDGFENFPFAAATARSVVEQLAISMVPAGDDPLRQQLVLFPGIPYWFNRVSTNAQVFP